MHNDDFTTNTYKFCSFRLMKVLSLVLRWVSSKSPAIVRLTP